MWLSNDTAGNSFGYDDGPGHRRVDSTVIGESPGLIEHPAERISLADATRIPCTVIGGDRVSGDWIFRLVVSGVNPIQNLVKRDIDQNDSPNDDLVNRSTLFNIQLKPKRLCDRGLVRSHSRVGESGRG